MTTRTLSIANELRIGKLTAKGRLSVVLDATEAQDSISLILELAKLLAAADTENFDKQSVLYISTRSRSEFHSQDTRHAHPYQSRAASTAFAYCTTFDPYKSYSKYAGLSSEKALTLLVKDVIEAAKQNDARLVVVECIFSLHFVFGVNASAFIRTILSRGFAVLAACPTGCGVNDDAFSLCDVADTVIDLRDLQTGFAMDVDGMIQVSKEGGRWKDIESFRRYKITDSSFAIFT